MIAACAPGPRKPAAATPKPPPARATTAGDPLLAILPAGADAVAEIDLARLRANAVVAPLIAAAGRREALGIDPLHDIDAAAAAVYRLGEDDAATLFVLRGPGLREAKIPDSERIDETTLLVGPAALRERPRGGGVAGDNALMTLRAAAMPAKAQGAAVRIAARLSPRARVAAAGRLALDEVPGTLSLWLDVADDAALVAILGASDDADARRVLAILENASTGARAPWFLPPRDGLRTEQKGATVRVVWVLAPRAFERWARELRERATPTRIES